MNKFSKVLAKVDLYHKKASKLFSEAASSEDLSNIKENLKSFLSSMNKYRFIENQGLMQRASGLLNMLNNPELNEGNVHSIAQAVLSFMDSVEEAVASEYSDSDAAKVKSSSQWTALKSSVNYAVSPTKTVKPVATKVDYLSALKTGLAQVKKFLDANVGSDQTPKSTGPERSKNLSAAAAMISGMAKVVNKAAETYSSEYLGAGKYSQLLSLLEDFGQSMQIQLGREYSSSLKGAVDNLIKSAKLNLDMFRGPKAKPQDFSIMKNKQYTPSIHEPLKLNTNIYSDHI